MKKNFFKTTALAALLITALPFAAFCQDTDDSLIDVNFAASEQGAVATASSGTAASANDGNEGSRWESEHGVDPQWWMVDLGQQRTFNTIQILWEAAYGKSFTIEVSNNQSEWNTIVSVADQSLVGFPYLQFLSFDAVSAQYVRFTGTARGTNYGYSFFEFRVIMASPSELAILEAVPAAEICKVGDNVNIQIKAQDQNGKPMDKAAEVEYLITPADAGSITGNVFMAAKRADVLVEAYIGEIKAEAFTICAYEGNSVALSTNIDTDNKIIAQSDFAPDGTNAFAAVDTDKASVWQGCPTNTTDGTEEARTYDAWFVVDLGNVYDVYLISILFEGACSQEYHVDFSADNVNWNTGYEYVGKEGIYGHTQNIYGNNLANADAVRYVRFYSTKAATGYGLKIFDFAVYATVTEGYETKLDNASLVQPLATKQIINGQLVITRDGVRYNTLGQTLNN